MLYADGLISLFLLVTGLAICSWYCGPERFWTYPSTTARQHTWEWGSHEDCLLSEKQPASGWGVYWYLTNHFSLYKCWIMHHMHFGLFPGISHRLCVFLRLLQNWRFARIIKIGEGSKGSSGPAPYRDS